MAKVVVALMDNRQEADRAAQELQTRCGCARADIRVVTHGAALIELGVPQDEADEFAEELRRGGALVVLQARTDEAAQCAAQVLRGTDAPRTGAPAGRDSGVLPVTQEELIVGKRQVSKGGVRIDTSVVERPVSETVQLREERAVIERRPVDRAVAPSDQAFKEITVEITETAEEPVVQKRARVVEEVVVRRETTQHDETVQDTVRKTDVHVERTGVERRKSAGPYSGVERRSSPR